MDHNAVQEVSILRYQDGGFREVLDHVIREEPLEIWAQGRCLARTVRLPREDRELVLGWCCCAGLVSSSADILEVRMRTGGGLTRAEVLFAPHVRSRLDREREPGFCVQEGTGAVPHVGQGCRIRAEDLFQARDILYSGQRLFQATGGAHCAAIFAQGPRLLALAEDVGRHNALDKVVGKALGAGISEGVMMLMSSRLNSEVVGKAVWAGLPLLAGVSAPTDHGVHLARQSGMTLIGFLRSGRFNLYTHPWRITS
ncbi:formate dehydrogenase accessory sulfurtransferase FdhD [Desulfovermiculus halophilus]|uniref:formate dehydrogenase accessory sulfurtransferase FdhD n=1 Tax=Desulfovermiculus halophilus TaxID=339722 RepID=UPI0004890291|nr:formate dehydrogenase accessory sulfurtransferase FdhD [Desulfovermiculus halophilus]